MTEIVDHLLFLNLAVVEPVTGVWFIRRFERRLAQGDKDARLAMYSRSIVLYWAYVVALLTHWIVAGRSATSLGLAVSLDIPFAVAMTACGLLTLWLLGQIRAARSMTAETAEGLRRQVESVMVAPQTAGERAVWFWVSVTAGFCEELWCRGFMLFYLAPWIGWWQAAVASSILFGIGHAYQGPAGVLKTTVVGLVMAALYGYSGSLWPSILLHTAIDVQAAAVAREALARTESVEGGARA